MKHSTVRLRRLARELRTLRAATGMTTEAAAEQLGWSRSKLNRFETGKGAPTPADVAAICHLYCAEESTTEAVVQLTREVARRGWWTAYSDVFTGSYVEFEAAADEIRHWAPLLVPGLLQNEDYARAIIQAGHPDRPDIELTRRVDARMQRKTSLFGTRLALHVIIAESVLRHPIGSPGTMAHQLDDILHAMDQSNITVQILPLTVGAHGGMEGAFSVLLFDGDDPNLGYAECPAGEVYVEDEEQVRRLILTFERLASMALSPEESAALIAAVRSEHVP